MLHSYLLLGSQGKCIRLWSFDGTSELDALRQSRERLEQVGTKLLPPDCILVLRDGDEPPDMEAYAARTTCKCKPGVGDGFVSADSRNFQERMLGLIKRSKTPRAWIRKHLIADEAEKLEAAERDQSFGLDEAYPLVPKLFDGE